MGCAHVMTWTETCTETQTSCDFGSSPENCPYGNYCVDMYVGCVGAPSAAPSSGYGGGDYGGVAPSGDYWGVAPSGSYGGAAPSGDYWGVSPSGAPSPSSGYDYGA